MRKFLLIGLFIIFPLQGMHQAFRAKIPTYFNRLHWGISAGPFLVLSAGAYASWDKIDVCGESITEPKVLLRTAKITEKFGLNPNEVKFLSSSETEHADSLPRSVILNSDIVKGLALALDDKERLEEELAKHEHVLQKSPGDSVELWRQTSKQEWRNFINEFLNEIDFFIGHELAHIKNHDSRRKVALAPLFPFITHYLLKPFSRSSSLAVENNLSTARLFFKHAARVPTAFGKLFLSFYAIRMLGMHAEYRADMQAGKTLGPDACRAGAEFFLNRYKQEHKEFVGREIDDDLDEFFSKGREKIKNLKKYSEMSDDQIEEMINAIEKEVRRSQRFFYLIQYTPVRLLVDVHPSNLTRANYLSTIADELEQKKG